VPYDRVEKTREDLLRRAARRQGLLLSKSRQRDHRGHVRAHPWGLYSVPADRWVVSRGDQGWGLDLAEIEAYLTQGAVPDDASLVL